MICACSSTRCRACGRRTPRCAPGDSAPAVASCRLGVASSNCASVCLCPWAPAKERSGGQDVRSSEGWGAVPGLAGAPGTGGGGVFGMVGPGLHGGICFSWGQRRLLGVPLLNMPPGQHLKNQKQLKLGPAKRSRWCAGFPARTGPIVWCPRRDTHRPFTQRHLALTFHSPALWCVCPFCLSTLSPCVLDTDYYPHAGASMGIEGKSQESGPSPHTAHAPPELGCPRALHQRPSQPPHPQHCTRHFGFIL